MRIGAKELAMFGAGAMVIVREETFEDAPAVRRVNELAFGQAIEANLVEALRGGGKAVVSLVAVEDGRVVGHILFSPVRIEPASGEPAAVGLGPMAVLPEYQSRGIGSLLVKAGLAACRQQGHDCVVVLGHPEYYPRFGFVPASRFGLRCGYDAPDEAFMALELKPGALQSQSGTVRYAPEFDDA